MSLQHIQKNSPRLLPKPAKFEKNPPNGYRVIRKTKCGAGGAAGAGSSPIHKQASLAGRLISIEEIKGAIRKLKNNKAPGIDNITGELLKAEIDTAAKWLKKIYDEIWEAEETPKDWAKGLLITLPKKGDLTKCENWRGITLISIPSKILGHILIERIKKGLEDKLRPEQARFRSGRRTSDQIFILKNIIEQCQEWQAPLYMNFVDFEKAFDSVHRETLWKRAADYGIPKKIVDIIKQLYKNTEISILNGSIQTDWIKIISGVKQGCNMSGFLFLLVFDWVMRKCVDGKSTGIRWNFMNRLEDLEFADNIALISSKFEDMQMKTNKLEETASKTGLKININKTKSMRINTKINNSMKRIMKIFWPIKITNSELREKANIKSVQETMKEKRWKYIGHILRRDRNDNRRIALQWTPEGKRKKGRPKETWRRMAEKELKEMGWKTWEAAARVAADRQQWNDMCSALCSTRSEEDKQVRPGDNP